MIKTTAADKWFSLCVRERAAWCCERCGKYYPEGEARRGIHCSHFHGRGKWSVRFDPMNATAACYGCHQHLGGNPYIHERYMLEKLGQPAFDALAERAQSLRTGRQMRTSKVEIAEHYRKQYSLMTANRMLGIEGRLEFVGYI